MAEFDNLQRAASETEVNSSVLDRYFALASTYPPSLSEIESLARKHLRKLRRDKAKAAYAIDARSETCTVSCSRRLRCLSGQAGLPDQGLLHSVTTSEAWSIAQAGSQAI